MFGNLCTQRWKSNSLSITASVGFFIHFSLLIRDVTWFPTTVNVQSKGEQAGSRYVKEHYSSDSSQV